MKIIRVGWFLLITFLLIVNTVHTLPYIQNKGFAYLICIVLVATCSMVVIDFIEFRKERKLKKKR